MGLQKTVNLPSGTTTSGYWEGARLSTSKATFETVKKGTTAPALKVALVAPDTASAALSIVTVANTSVTVNLATDADKNVTTTVLQLQKAVAADSNASKEVTVRPSYTGKWEDVVAPLVLTTLADGKRNRKQGTGSTGWTRKAAKPRPNAKY